MSRNPNHDCLFEPVTIGPVTAPNRFYQVPHCNGGGYRDPSAVTEMRRIKAEGGWGVVFTEQVELHHSSEITPYIELRLWEDSDIPMLARMAEAIKSGGALAGIELAYPGINGPNLYTREVPMAPSALPIRSFSNEPLQARTMTRRDIRDLRRWHRQACLRAKHAGYDLICLYGAHGFGAMQHFLSTVTNQRSDEYGGSLENRSRLLRELIAEARDAVGDSLGITVRLSLEEWNGQQGFRNEELRELIATWPDLPDLWDLAHGAWEDCSTTARFTEEGAQQSLVAGLHELTDKPIVGVGRFTSVDLMVKQVRDGTLDFIGCARPSIADPWLPRKIDEGRVDDIRECIGCNICVSGDMTMSLARCTQNPSFMEEWRKGWHPEIISRDHQDERTVLVVGAGPAGLEATRVLAARGYEVVLADAAREPGGRINAESRLPGLSSYARVRDYRLQQIRRLPNVQIYPDNTLTADDVLGFEAQHVALATGADWRADAVARFHTYPIDCDDTVPVYTPDDIMAGRMPSGAVLLYDDDHYYMGSVLAEALVQAGCHVTLLTPAARVADWTVHTLEQGHIQSRLASLGVVMQPNRAILSVSAGCVQVSDLLSGNTHDTPADALLVVAGRTPRDSLWQALCARESEWADAGVASIACIGDCEAPAPIAWATYAGHRYARELGHTPAEDRPPFRRDVIALVQS